MTQSKSKTSAFAKVTIFFTVSFLVGVGLCGLDYALAAKGIGKSTQEFGIGPLDGVSIVMMILSAIGLVITTVLWILVAVIRSFSPKEAAPQQLLEEKDETKPDDH
jgi:hypothetical protein